MHLSRQNRGCKNSAGRGGKFLRPPCLSGIRCYCSLDVGTPSNAATEAVESASLRDSSSLAKFASCRVSRLPL
ncbi:hypothetical protein POVWA2_024830 [Plasmodium ovale wallikeri]|uniref:Uncharacterized protein n=1 Tax=Plasmodium ovale wallikeri TaxID=864142 RepID=A0A1A8YV34_PLAOA|nr:hypothetical protein POVWA1_024980 [Plasmodium ovale wallikeri]SBT35391.1 hypothetical protein POVWA2_024830 [Plasmodium ovale wallikeri]